MGGTDARARRGAHHGRMDTIRRRTRLSGRIAAFFETLAGRRSLGVGLALAVECVILAALGRIGTSAVVGLPAAVAASIGGTVAVVFGLVDGAVVAVAGAVVFGAAAGWGSSELTTLVVWPAVVGGAGLVGRRIERHKALLRGVLAKHEQERAQLAFELKDEIAQVLTGALLALRRAQRNDSAPSAELAEACRLVQQSIADLREAAIGLRPSALDQFGLGAAITRLADHPGQEGDLDVRLGPGWDARLAPDVEREVFRVVRDILEAVASHGPGTVWLGLERTANWLTIVARETTSDSDEHVSEADLGLVSERVRLLGGHFRHSTIDGTAMTVAQLSLR